MKKGGIDMSEKSMVAQDKNEKVIKAGPVSQDRKIFTPEVDICENEDGFIIIANMPGVSKEGVNVDFEDGELKIYGRVDSKYDGYKPLLSEYSIGDYSRTY
jgi:HSP20 family molecular chaperone IbpA